MRIKAAAMAVGLIAALGATAPLVGSASAQTRHGHRAHTHHPRGHRRTVKPQPLAGMPQNAGGVIQDPVWGHQGNLRTLRPSNSLTMRPSGSLRPHSVLPPGNGPGGEDPIQSECWDANAYIANAAPFPPPDQGPQVGYVANWYSPDCGTNWAEAVITNDPGVPGEVLYDNIVDQVTGEAYDFYTRPAINGTYTDMTDSPTTTACAHGGLNLQNGTNYETALSSDCA